MPKIDVKFAGFDTRSSLMMFWPASRTRIEREGLEERRLARTRPEVPPPIMMKSYFISVIAVVVVIIINTQTYGFFHKGKYIVKIKQ